MGGRDAEVSAYLRFGSKVSGVDGSVSGLDGSTTKVKRAEDNSEPANGNDGLHSRQEHAPERRPSAPLLGLQIFVGSLLFFLGCLRFPSADDRLNRGVHGARRYSVMTLLFVFGGLLLNAISATLLAQQ